jgi:hypothetical protein
MLIDRRNNLAAVGQFLDKCNAVREILNGRPATSKDEKHQSGNGTWTELKLSQSTIVDEQALILAIVDLETICKFFKKTYKSK